MSTQSQSLIAIGAVSNISPFNADVPDPSIEVKVSVVMPSAGGITTSLSGSGGTTITTEFEPTDLEKFSRISVSILLENATMQNLPALMDAIKLEVTGKATNLLNLPEVF